MGSGYFSWQRMENDQGDLGDIIRASRCGGAPSTGHRIITSNRQAPPAEPPSFLSPAEGPNVDDFGETFSNFGDPLLRDLADATSFHCLAPTASLVDVSTAGDDGGGAMAVRDGGDNTNLIKQKTHGGVELKKPCDIFSRVLQIPPGVKASSMFSPRVIKPSPELAGNMAKANSSSACCPLNQQGLQISSPRTPGIKRRKNLAKKVVCIPAPAAANSRPSGEVVPPDLWAWRKYGQKPIKGSPHPRGYYRCSSSKGCSARKQVERSRSDPNMLVITYTAEHNHPWPTQRNALAGSTRSQPAWNSSSAPKSSPLSRRPRAMVKEGHSKESPSTANITPSIKEEVPETGKMTVGINGEHNLDHALRRRYETNMPETSQSDDVFADLGELETDPMRLVFSKFLGDKPDEESESGHMDPFGGLDWGGSSFGETRKEVL